MFAAYLNEYYAYRQLQKEEPYYLHSRTHQNLFVLHTSCGNYPFTVIV